MMRPKPRPIKANKGVREQFVQATKYLKEYSVIIFDNLKSTFMLWLI